MLTEVFITEEDQQDLRVSVSVTNIRNAVSHLRLSHLCSSWSLGGLSPCPVSQLLEIPACPPQWPHLTPRPGEDTLIFRYIHIYVSLDFQTDPASLELWRSVVEAIFLLVLNYEAIISRQTSVLRFITGDL